MVEVSCVIYFLHLLLFRGKIYNGKPAIKGHLDTNFKCKNTKKIHLLWAPYAPKDTAAAPEMPANLTKGLPWITKFLNDGISEGKINGYEVISLVGMLDMVWRSFGYPQMI